MSRTQSTGNGQSPWPASEPVASHHGPEAMTHAPLLHSVSKSRMPGLVSTPKAFPATMGGRSVPSSPSNPVEPHSTVGLAVVQMVTAHWTFLE